LSCRLTWARWSIPAAPMMALGVFSGFMVPAFICTLPIFCGACPTLRNFIWYFIEYGFAASSVHSCSITSGAPTTCRERRR